MRAVRRKFGLSKLSVRSGAVGSHLEHGIEVHRAVHVRVALIVSSRPLGPDLGHESSKDAFFHNIAALRGFVDRHCNDLLAFLLDRPR